MSNSTPSNAKKENAEKELEAHGLPEKHAEMIADAETDPAHQPTSHEGEPEEGWSRAALLERAGELGVEGTDAMSDESLKATIEKHDRDTLIQKSAGVASHENSSDIIPPGDGIIS